MQIFLLPLLYLSLSSTICVELPGDQKFEPPTPHISAPKGAFAKTVILPNDPKKSAYIAQKFLQDSKLVNDVRGIQGYTGYYKGIRISVMASGMGMPTMGIYSYELFNAYDVKNIIRIGTIWAYREDIKVKDILVASSASTNSNYGKNFHLDGIISGSASFELLKNVNKAVGELGFQDKVKFGQVLSTDNYYTDEPGNNLKWIKMGVMGVEMEGYSLYLNAARAGKNAIVMATCTDHLIRNEHLSPEEIQDPYDDMIVLALETAVDLGE